MKLFSLNLREVSSKVARSRARCSLFYDHVQALVLVSPQLCVNQGVINPARSLRRDVELAASRSLA